MKVIGNDGRCCVMLQVSKSNADLYEIPKSYQDRLKYW